MRSVSQISAEALATGTTARYECRIKVEYQKDLMRLVEEGMIVGVKNFKSTLGDDRFTLLEISRVYPEHFGMKGLTDYSYYPVQFEIIEQSVSDWKSDDKSTMMIQINAIPINYDLLIRDGGEPEYEKGFSYPIIAEEARILNREMIHQMYNRRILEKMGKDWRTVSTVADSKKDPRLGTIKMFESSDVNIPIYVDFEKLVRYHFGLFSFTGSGKSNLLSNIFRRLIHHTRDTKIIIFDISMEYPFLLMDLFASEKISSKLVLEAQIKAADEMFETMVKPRDFEGDKRVRDGFDAILKQGKVEHYIKPLFQEPTFTEFLRELDDLRKEAGQKATYRDAVDDLHEAVLNYISEKHLDLDVPIPPDFVEHISAVAQSAVEKKVSDRSNLYAWAMNLGGTLKTKMQRARKYRGKKGVTVDNILELAEGPTRLLCLSIADPTTIKDLAIKLTDRALYKRKKQFKVEPYILFVFDEAQEFVPSLKDATGIDRDCSFQVETLLRQGRKYGLGACIATQRIAYLNTNALQQLHTYFVGTLPRTYDRSVVSDTFMIDKTILEKTLEFAPGEWLLSSYIATGMENVPIFIKADNAEDSIQAFLKGTG